MMQWDECAFWQRRLHTQTHKHVHAYTTSMHAYMCALTHTRTYAHTHTHTYLHTHTHTNMPTHARAQFPSANHCELRIINIALQA